MTQRLLSDLARVKATFQLRAIETVIAGQPARFVFISEDTRRALYARDERKGG